MKFLLAAALGATLLFLLSCRQGQLTQKPEQDHGRGDNADTSAVIDQLRGVNKALETCASAARLSKNKARPGYEECISREPHLMAADLEDEFLNAFQRNPTCKGITIVRETNASTYALNPRKDIRADPELGGQDRARSATAEEGQRYSHAKYQVYFDLKVTKEGDIDWNRSQWQLSRSSFFPAVADISIHGSMGNLDRETSAFCGVIRGDGGSVR